MAARGEKMQSLVLEALRRQSEPQSAYALMDVLRADLPRLAPPSVYRALAALVEQGLVHRLESIKAYVASRHGVHASGCILAICEDCGGVEEHVSPGLIDDLTTEAGKSGFATTRHVVEVHGHCATCAEPGSSS